LYKRWLQETADGLRERAVELIVTYRNNDIYFKETFCKMSQGLASQRAWREAEATRSAFDNEFGDIMEWAKRIKPGWEKTIMNQCSNSANQQQMRLAEAQQVAEAASKSDQENSTRLRLEAKILASKKKKEAAGANHAFEAAKAAEEELLSEEKKAVNKKKTVKGT
jgi:hypothetical protein